MDRTKMWQLTVYLDEHDKQTRARARLVTGDRELTGSGLAQLRSHDSDVPEIGDELATARALSDLAHQLLDAAAGDIEAITHEQATLSL